MAITDLTTTSLMDSRTFTQMNEDLAALCWALDERNELFDDLAFYSPTGTNASSVGVWNYIGGSKNKPTDIELDGLNIFGDKIRDNFQGVLTSINTILNSPTNVIQYVQSDKGNNIYTVGDMNTYTNAIEPGTNIWTTSGNPTADVTNAYQWEACRIALLALIFPVEYGNTTVGQDRLYTATGDSRIDTGDDYDDAWDNCVADTPGTSSGVISMEWEVILAGGVTPTASIIDNLSIEIDGSTAKQSAISKAQLCFNVSPTNIDDYSPGDWSITIGDTSKDYTAGATADLFSSTSSSFSADITETEPSGSPWQNGGSGTVGAWDIAAADGTNGPYSAHCVVWYDIQSSMTYG